MPVFEIHPEEDPKWAAVIESDPRSSIFHTPAWLEALRRTYRYIPRVLTTSPPGAPLANGIVFCQVESWLTGSKLVSLPFSDHCEPLFQDASSLEALLRGISERASGKFRYAEIRPRSTEFPTGSGGWAASGTYSFHVLDLRPSIEELYSRLHHDSMQRKIRRADRESVVLEQGRSDIFLKQFYALLLLTRRRHGLPPQPFAWFQNLVDCLGDRLTIRLARVNDRPIASILTLRHKQTIVYKYGCSDERFHKLGGMPRLFWQIIEEARLQQLKELDLGRSDQNNPGLIQFKDHLGATKTVLNYWRFSQRPQLKRTGSGGAWKSRITHSVLAKLPDGLFRLAGEIFYRHAG